MMKTQLAFSSCVHEAHLQGFKKWALCCRLDPGKPQNHDTRQEGSMWFQGTTTTVHGFLYPAPDKMTCLMHLLPVSWLPITIVIPNVYNSFTAGIVSLHLLSNTPQIDILSVLCTDNTIVRFEDFQKWSGITDRCSFLCFHDTSEQHQGFSNPSILRFQSRELRTQTCWWFGMYKVIWIKMPLINTYIRTLSGI